MFDSNEPSVILHADTECNCVPAEEFCAPNLNRLPASIISSQNTACVDNKKNNFNKAEMPTHKYRNNVISITTAIRSSVAIKPGKVRAMGVSSIEFVYPMLECSWPD
jgi:hypothetical protein